MNEYDRLSNYLPKLAIADKLDNAEDLMIKS